MKSLRWLLAVVVGVLLAGSAWAQPYPNKPIRLVVPYPPGQGTDVLARLIAERMSASIGQQVVVDTRPGAGAAGIEAMGGVPVGADIAGLVRALADAREQGARGRPAADENNREPKRIDEVYRETYTTLLRHCRVEHPEEVAPLWRRLANAAKGEQQAIIQHELTKVCMIRGLAPELYCPVVTTAVKQSITAFTFASSGIDDLTTGCNPFLVSYAGARAQQEAREVANLSLQLDQGVNQASLADVRSIRDKEKVKLPRNLHQVAVTCSAMLCSRTRYSKATLVPVII